MGKLYKKNDPVCLTQCLCFHKPSHLLIVKFVLNDFDASHALVWIPHLKLCIKHWAGKPRVPGEFSRTDIAWKEETHSYDGLFTVFADGTRLMQDNITVLCVNDNNPPGLSISTRSLWPAKRGRRGRWSTEDCGFCSSEVAKIAVPLVGHVTTGKAAEPESVLAGVWWNRTLTQMTGPDAFHLDGESEALVRNKCTVRGHKSTSYGRGVDTHGWKGKEIFYLNVLHRSLSGEKTLDCSRLQRSEVPRWSPRLNRDV